MAVLQLSNDALERLQIIIAVLLCFVCGAVSAVCSSSMNEMSGYARLCVATSVP